MHISHNQYAFNIYIDQVDLNLLRELGDVQFQAVWHPRLDDDPSYRWLRQVVSTILAEAATSSAGRGPASISDAET
jgi:uncharacterized protein YabN with tetrapyrrole methylase and pyrophosphatase domain